MKQGTIKQGVHFAGALALAAITLDYMTNTAGVQAQVGRELHSIGVGRAGARRRLAERGETDSRRR